MLAHLRLYPTKENTSTLLNVTVRNTGLKPGKLHETILESFDLFRGLERRSQYARCAHQGRVSSSLLLPAASDASG